MGLAPISRPRQSLYTSQIDVAGRALAGDLNLVLIDYAALAHGLDLRGDDASEEPGRSTLNSTVNSPVNSTEAPDGTNATESATGPSPALRTLHLAAANIYLNLIRQLPAVPPESRLVVGGWRLVVGGWLSTACCRKLCLTPVPRPRTLVSSEALSVGPRSPRSAPRLTFWTPPYPGWPPTAPPRTHTTGAWSVGP